MSYEVHYSYTSKPKITFREGKKYKEFKSFEEVCDELNKLKLELDIYNKTSEVMLNVLDDLKCEFE